MTLICPKCGGEKEGYRCVYCLRPVWRRRNAARGVRAPARLTRSVNGLLDGYVRQCLSAGTELPRGAWPEWLVRVKRLHLQLKRLERTEATYEPK